MIAQFLVSCTIFTLAKCESSETTEVVAKPRFYIEGDSYTINLIPFFIALKIAFVLGLLLKDVLSKEMEEYVSGSYYTDGFSSYGSPSSSYGSPSSYYVGDPTRIAHMATNEISDIGNLDYYSESSQDSIRVKPKHYIIDDEKKSDFETAAAALDVTLGSVGELGLSFLGTLVGLILPYHEDQSGNSGIPKLDFVEPTEDTLLQKGNFLRSITATPTPYYNTPTSTPSPYFSTAAGIYQDNHAYSVHPVSATPAPTYYQESTTAKPSLLFDPHSSTLYVDTHLANTLQLDDGTSVELPTDMLLDSINSGQVQLIGGNSRMDEDSNLMDQDMAYSSQNVAIKAQVVDKYAFNTRHESIKNLLHLQSQQKRKTPPHAHQHQNFGRPNEEWSPAPKEKVWYQINRPSFKRRKRRRRR